MISNKSTEVGGKVRLSAGLLAGSPDGIIVSIWMLADWHHCYTVTTIVCQFVFAVYRHSNHLYASRARISSVYAPLFASCTSKISGSCSRGNFSIFQNQKPEQKLTSLAWGNFVIKLYI